MADTETKFSRPRYWARWTYQRWLTRLPCRVRRFEDLFPAGCDYAGGVFAHRPRFTGILQREAGQPFLVRPTQWLGDPGSNLGSANETYWTREPDRIAYALSEAGVYGNYGRVYDPATRAFVTETCEDWEVTFDRHSALAMPGFPAPKRLPGITALLGTLGGQTFYHFFAETLPKLVFLAPYLENCDQIILSRYGETWKRRWLALWGLEHKALFVNELSHYVCDQLIFTNRLVRHFEASPWAVDVLRHLPGLPAPTALNPAGKVLWLDRTGDHMRSVTWEKDLVAAMPWVEPIRVADLSPVQTATVFGQARAVLGFHGAAFSNMVFCPPGVQVVEIFTTPNYPWYARLAQSSGHRHTALTFANDPAAIPALAAALRAAIAP